VYVIILIEGPDGSGKTTLANKIIEELPYFEYRHEGPPPKNEDPLVYYMRELYACKGNLVIDRFALGERVYGPILRDGDSIGDSGWRSFGAALRTCKAGHIVCLPDPAVSHANWASRLDTEYFTGHTDYFNSYARFAYFAHQYKLLTYDYKKDSVEDTLKELLKTLIH
jgi:GTPase SAR1 family protein